MNDTAKPGSNHQLVKGLQMHQDQCVEIARQAVVACAERHEYMPATEVLAEVWKPHRWVIDAMLCVATVAEGERDRYQAGNTELLGLFMRHLEGDDIPELTDRVREILTGAGLVNPDHTMNWQALEDRKTKQISRQQAVNELVNAPQERARLLAMSDEGGAPKTQELIKAAPSTERPAAHEVVTDVRTILLDVVPGPDGMGREVYANSVNDVVAKLTELAGQVESLKAELGDVTAARDEALHAPWPEWAEKIKARVRESSGYDGFDDLDGVDLPGEVNEHLSAIERQNERLREQLAAIRPAQLATPTEQERDDAIRDVVRVADSVEEAARFGVNAGIRLAHASQPKTT